MPGFTHGVLRPFRSNGQAVQLARQPDREVADVDHLLHFAQPFLQDLAGFERDQLAEMLLVFAQHFAETPHHLAAHRRRHQGPAGLRHAGAFDARIRIGQAAGRQMPEDLAVDGRAHRQCAGRAFTVAPGRLQPDGLPAGREFLCFHAVAS